MRADDFYMSNMFLKSDVNLCKKMEKKKKKKAFMPFITVKLKVEKYRVLRAISKSNISRKKSELFRTYCKKMIQLI